MPTLDAIGIALKRDRPIFDVRQYGGRNPAVKINDLSLSKAGFRIKYFVNVRKREFLVTDFDRARSHQRILPRRWPDAIANLSRPAPPGPAVIGASPYARCLSNDLELPV